MPSSPSLVVANAVAYRFLLDGVSIQPWDFVQNSNVSSICLPAERETSFLSIRRQMLFYDFSAWAGKHHQIYMRRATAY